MTTKCEKEEKKSRKKIFTTIAAFEAHKKYS